MSAMEKKEGKKNIFSPIAKFFREIKSELKKVVFPTAKQTRINTTVVIVAVIIVGILIGLLDFVFVTARNFVINYGEEPAPQAPVEATQDVAPELTPAQQAQMVLDELDSYTYDEAGNAVDENGEIIVQDDGNGNTVELNAETVAQIRESAQAALDSEVSAEATDVETTDAPEGGNE